MNVENIISGIWDQFFCHGGIVKGSYTSDLGLHFEVEVACSNFGYEKDGMTHRPEWERNFATWLEFVITARHEVFVRQNSRPGQHLNKQVAWTNPSNHDTCWRSDGLRMIHEVCGQAYDHCWSAVPEEHKVVPGLANIRCEVNNSIFSRGMVRFVRVHTASDGKGRRIIEDVKFAPFSIQFQE